MHSCDEQGHIPSPSDIGLCAACRKRIPDAANSLVRNVDHYERPTYGTSKCGHSERFLDWENHGKPIKCLACEMAFLRDLNDALYKSQTAANQECEIAEDKRAELQERLDAVATSEWDRLTRERDEARALLRNACHQYEAATDNSGHRWVLLFKSWYEEVRGVLE